MSDVSTESENGSKLGIEAIVNALQYFIETINIGTRIEVFMREIEIFITFVRAVKVVM